MFPCSAECTGGFGNCGGAALQSLSPVRKCADNVQKHVGAFCSFLSYIAGLSLLAIMVLTVVNVILRIPSTPIRGSVELSSLLFGIVFAFGVGLVTIKDEHIAVDLITQKMPLRVRNILGSIMALLGLGLWILIGWRTLVYGIGQYRIGEYDPILWNMRIAPWRFVLVFGLAILCLTLLIQLVRYVAKAVER